MLRLSASPCNNEPAATACAVVVHEETLTLPTYEPARPDRNPMFLERRVYQGSSGRVYPLPCIERFAEKPAPHAWRAIRLENEYVEVILLPELGGRIHAAKDKTNGYDIFYRNNVIKPALIGLAGAWISGGVELNWPQHHRPSTFMPVDVEIEKSPDGAVTVWMSEHDPLYRMKGMHGVCLHPGSSRIELKVRAYNRTPFMQTFLWWANVATEVHEAYQSFLPTDVTHVADHAKGSTSTFPRCIGVYYGVKYAERAAHGVPAEEVPGRYVPLAAGRPAADRALAGLRCEPNDLTWYANIPVPTSYMCLGSKGDFFGGYDHRRRAGLVHVANHHISPGKKQWTWGNQEFGYAWDRNLTDPDEHGDCRPYIELMAGVYTDNQPDFSFLQPGETKSWTQCWYPIREIGPAQQATTEAAVSLAVHGRVARIGVNTTRVVDATVRLRGKAGVLWRRRSEIAPDRPLVAEVELPRGTRAETLVLTVVDENGRELIRYEPVAPKPSAPAAATEPPLPQRIASNEELFITGLHLQQYRHPTRMPEPYFEEALRRDPADSRCHNALGLIRLNQGDFAAAERHFRAAVERLTLRNPNPYDGEALYNLGLALRFQADAAALAERDDAGRLLEEAYGAFYKATWNQAWQSAGYHAIAEIDCRRRQWSLALAHVDRALRVNADNLRARALKALVLRELGASEEADSLIEATLELDPLDWWTRHLRGEQIRCDSQTRLDLAHDCVRAGFYRQALDLLAGQTPECTAGTGPTLAYTRAGIHQLLGESKAAAEAQREAREQPTEYCFPSRLEELALLEWAIGREPRDARAHYYRGNLLYDRKRHHDAIAAWEKSARLDPAFSIVWRNLGIGYFNYLEAPARARRAYDRACRIAPDDARLQFERDLLWKRVGVDARKRLAALEKKPALVRLRDDLSVEFLDLLNQVGRHEEALAYLQSRRFQPWEGGEGLARGQHERTHLALGRRALAAGEPSRAMEHFSAALVCPPNLGEACHLLANRSHFHYWIGCAAAALGDSARATDAWSTAAAFRSDFQERAVRVYSELTYFSARSLEKLGRKREAQALFRSVREYARQLFREEAKVYYFATSLPARLLFENLQRRQETTALLIEAQAEIGLGRRARARALLQSVLERDPSRALARDLLDELG